MKKLYVLIVFCWIIGVPSVLAQSAVDSLELLLEEARTDSARIDLLLELSGAVSSHEDALAYSREAAKLAEKKKLTYRQALALKTAGLVNYRQGDYVTALTDYQQALDLFRSADDPAGVSNILNNIGAIYNEQGDDAKALEFFLEALRYGEQADNTLRTATALLNVGTVYMKKAETYEKGIQTLERAIPLFEEIDYPLGVGVICVNLGEIFLNQEKLDSALHYLERSKEIFTGLSESFLSYSLNLIGKAYIQSGNFQAAIQNQEEAIKVAERSGAKLELGHAYLGLADSYQADGKVGEAQQNYRQAEEIYLELGAKEGLQEVYKGLANTYERQSDYKNAYRYSQLFSTYKDSVYNIATADKVRSLSFTYELEKKETEIDILNAENELQQAKIERAVIMQNFLYATAVFLIVTIGGISYQYWYARKSNKIISEERNRSENILLNILPMETASELKENGYVEAKRFDQTTVMFTDFKQFTTYAENMPPEELVKSIDYYFRGFDEIIYKYGLEKIKTIGDAYMCAGGLPVPNRTNAEDAVRAALEILDFVRTVKEEQPVGILPFDVRIGISTGPVVAGVVGTKKFQYDIWGATVNLASIMETNAEANTVNISAKTHALVMDKFVCKHRGAIKAKHGGKFKMYFVEGVLEKASDQLKQRPQGASKTT